MKSPNGIGSFCSGNESRTCKRTKAAEDGGVNGRLSNGGGNHGGVFLLKFYARGGSEVEKAGVGGLVATGGRIAERLRRDRQVAAERC